MAAVLAALLIAAIAGGLFAPPSQAAVPANGRAWELITERQPSSTRSLGLRPLGNSSDRLVYTTIGPPPGSLSGAFLGFGSAVRGSSGWTHSPYGLPYTTGGDEIFELVAPVYPIVFSADEKTILWVSSVPLVPGAPPEEEELLSLYRTIGSGAPEFIAIVGKGWAYEHYVGFAELASAGRVVFTTDRHVIAGDSARTEGESIYVWDGSEVELLDVDAGGALLSTCGSSLSKFNGMAPFASHLFFTATQCGGTRRAYIRNLQANGAVEISASECTRLDCGPAADVTFAGATPDGRFAYLTTAQQLTNADEDATEDLYRYSVSSGKLTLLSGAPSAVSGAVEPSLVVPSEDGARVYFRASGEMIPGESTSGKKIFMADSGGLHLVAAAALGELTPVPLAPELQVSADGKQALFVTPSQVLGSDTDKNNDAYLYDADSASLTHLSKGPSGGNGAYPASIDAPSPLNRHPFENGNYRPFYALTEAGDRSFFVTEESLLPEDTNGTFDVYEWTGTLGLVTPGYQPMKSDFAGISRDGKSVIFATNATLVPTDEDGDGRDLYAARLGGGFPEGQPPQCDPASCPLPGSARVVRATPASMLPLARKKSGALRLIEVASKAKKGAIAVVVSAPAPGRVSGSVWVREGGKKVVLAQGSRQAKKAGKVQLSLRLTASARSAGAGAKTVQVTVSEGSAKVSKTAKVSLR